MWLLLLLKFLLLFCFRCCFFFVRWRINYGQLERSNEENNKWEILYYLINVCMNARGLLECKAIHYMRMHRACVCKSVLHGAIHNICKELSNALLITFAITDGNWLSSIMYTDISIYAHANEQITHLTDLMCNVSLVLFHFVCYNKILLKLSIVNWLISVSFSFINGVAIWCSLTNYQY